ncbi:leucyl/phenylalanyl-tRNA--protein transferase [Frigidibacter sp. RF13]|uniref:leucyl/phenylalanyl-tRNA--protein transferase n=1 Tax=Frigidibacter sp. RF13 TaxID=2997340 RepID=UPI002270B6BD|nr:leucyl/phenylalanyl-tRNA--protein transferase [Frigidibacter sp. RF13]MCY1125682.1 leucyl/phenylalanyl-tRNA--protein transferase [Frigidibacter sp. RF13]
MLQGYRRGIFPMAESRESPQLHWVEPRLRGILPLDGFHLSRSLRRRILRGGYEIAIDRDFMGTVRACADRPETWINDTLLLLYGALFSAGHAHSLEVWRDGRLIGGVFGVTFGQVFCGETMFSRETDASKIALAYLVDRLRRTGFLLFDTQFLTPHLASLGAVEISQSHYLQRLAVAREMVADFGAADAPQPPELVSALSSAGAGASGRMQDRTQTS